MARARAGVGRRDKPHPVEDHDVTLSGSYARLMDAEATAEVAVRAARERLRGTAPANARVDSLFWYGAVAIDLQHLVVWVLLSGLPDDDLPEWYFSVPGQEAGVPDVGTSLLEWIATLRDVVHTEFKAVGWPDPTSVSVGFDSSSRVASGGGWHFFA